jgi:hypothetical protein
MFDRLTEHFKLLADHAGKALTVRQQLDASQIDEEDRDERGDTNHLEASKPAGDRGSSLGEQHAARRWPRRAS